MGGVEDFEMIPRSGTGDSVQRRDGDREVLNFCVGWSTMSVGDWEGEASPSSFISGLTSTCVSVEEVMTESVGMAVKDDSLGLCV